MLRDYQQRAIDDLHDYLEKYDAYEYIELDNELGW